MGVGRDELRALSASTRITAPSSLTLISICPDDPTVSIQYGLWMLPSDFVRQMSVQKTEKRLRPCNRQLFARHEAHRQGPAGREPYRSGGQARRPLVSWSIRRSRPAWLCPVRWPPIGGPLRPRQCRSRKTKGQDRLKDDNWRDDDDERAA